MQDWTLMDDKNGVNNGGLDNAKSFSQWSLLQRESVCGLTRIQELNLAANRIRDFHVAGAGGSSTDTAEAERCRAPELKELNLSLNLLTAVPRNLSEFAPNLEILNLSYNEIESAALDATYAAMAALRYLDLSRNRIHHLDADDFAAVAPGAGTAGGGVPLEILSDGIKTIFARPRHEDCSVL